MIQLKRGWYRPDGRACGGTQTGDMLVVWVQASSNQNIPDALLVDRVPAGFEVENMNLSQSPEMQEWTIGGVRVAGAMSNPNIKHREFRDDRYVAAVALGRGKVDVFYLVRVTPGLRGAVDGGGRHVPAGNPWRGRTMSTWKSAIAARSVLDRPGHLHGGRRARRRWRRRGILAASVLLTLAALLFALDRLFPLPPIDSGGAAVVVSADGTPLRNYPSRDGIWRYPVTPAQVSPRYLETLLTYEDRWFYWHPGVNPVAGARRLAVGHQPAHRVRRLDADRRRPRSTRSWPGRLPAAHAPMGGIVEGVKWDPVYGWASPPVT